MTGFQRARSEEQRTERRESILRTAAAMLGEMPVSAVSLNELSRRVGLAKSNVLRYFESREAVLLEVLAEDAARFRAGIAESLPATVDPAAPVETRVRVVATELAAAFARRPILCELLDSQEAVLERNVSFDVALRYKRAARDRMAEFAVLLRRLLPELDEERAARAVHLVILLVGPLWTRSRPAPAVLAAYQADASVAFLHAEFATALTEATNTFLLGLLAETAKG